MCLPPARSSCLRYRAQYRMNFSLSYLGTDGCVANAKSYGDRRRLSACVLRRSNHLEDRPTMSKSPMPVEKQKLFKNRRQWQRQLTLKTAKIRSPDLPSGVDCAILDISEGGACILLPAGAAVPDTFDLSMHSGGQIYLCRVMWKVGHRIGVSFQSLTII
jgi:hypothetical protein